MASPQNGDASQGGRSIVELVESAKAGSREDLARLFEMFEPMMLRWARRRLGQPLRTLDETRDILHDAWQVVLRRIGSFEMEDSRSFPRWLRGIITRVVLQKAQNPYLKRRQALTEEFQPPDLELTPMTRLSLDELVHLRYRLLRNFDRMDRVIYRLRARGVSSAAIADRVGMSDRAVRMRFARTDARLRLRMKQLAEAPERG